MSSLNEKEAADIARRISESMSSANTNGIAISNPSRPRFDGTINLGHVLTVVTMLLGLLTVYVNSEVKQADHESRIKALESAQKEFKESQSKQIEIQQVTTRNQDKVNLMLEMVLSRKNEINK